MNVGILGSGPVAQALARGFLKHGDGVMLGTGHPDKLVEWQAENREGLVGSFADAARFGEIVVLAVKGSAATAALRRATAENVAGKTVIDTTNPIADAPPENGVLKFTTTLHDSLMERLQREFPEARFVKAFNSVGHALMVEPALAGGQPTMFICGNDDQAKKDAVEILDRFGWESADMGRAEAARAIEPLCILWCIPGFLEDDWAHAFKLLRQG